MKISTVLVLLLPTLVGALSFFPLKNERAVFHSEAERALFRAHLTAYSHPLPTASFGDPDHRMKIDSNILFPNAKACSGCHGRDPLGKALVTSLGEDVNIYDDWRSSMMANSARDPFWRAKVTHETLINPAHSMDLQDKCTSCHAPSGHYQAKLHDKKTHYTLANLYTDTLGLDGVNCQMCHAQAPALIGSLHSGALNFDTNKIRIAYGPYEKVFDPPMREFVGITPMFGEQISDAGVCAGCHTLITKSVDSNGQYTGGTFVEQATYHEWLNSRYDAQHDQITCQGCHLPQIPDAVVISGNYQFLNNKFPFGVHEMAGANVPMLKLMKENRVTLDIPAKPEHFDSTLAATLRMLQQKTLDLKLETGALTGDSVYFSLKMVNKAGHKFPSGYPARRAWVEFEVRDQIGKSVFHSGRMNPDFSLPDEDPGFEPHYQTIDRPDQVQIYELVPGDIAGSFTTVLERGHIGLKDNRLVPQGFLRTDPAYDTTRIIGAALTDPDFNHSAAGVEGTGGDVLHFRLKNEGYTGYLSVTARVWYQSLPPKWMIPMFAFSSPEIDAFKAMFDAVDRSPVLVAEQVLDSVFVSPVSTQNAQQEDFIKIGPNPTNDGRLTLSLSSHTQLRRIRVWDAAGRLVWDRVAGEVWLPSQRGVYMVVVETNRGRVVRKLLRE